MSRAHERSAEADITRIRLLEGDADRFDGSISDLRKEMKEGFAKCEADNEGLRRLLTGLLVAIVMSSLSIVATVLITAGGGS